MAVLRAAYPRYYDKTDAIEAEQAARLWATMFEDDDCEIVLNAVKTVIATSEFPPTVAEVKKKIKLLTEEPEMTELEAWSIVRKALRNSAYNSEEEFAKLPPEIQDVVHAPEQLKDWAIMDADEVNTVIASNFQRSFRVRSKQVKELAAIPSSVREYLKGVSDMLPVLPDADEEF